MSRPPSIARKKAAFREGTQRAVSDASRLSLQELGWADGRNLTVDIKWGGAGRDLVYNNAGPDLIMAPGSAAAGPALQATRSIPRFA